MLAIVGCSRSFRTFVQQRKLDRCMGQLDVYRKLRPYHLLQMEKIDLQYSSKEYMLVRHIRGRKRIPENW